MGRLIPVFQITMGLLGILCIILFPETALAGMTDGIELCTKSIIPSLFPFIFLSGFLSGTLSALSFGKMNLPEKVLGIPKGAESILFLGCLGGYPTGVHMIHKQYSSGTLSKKEAHHMLGFCSNAGPSFIFGIAGTFFDHPASPWLLWLIQIISAILVAVILKSDNPRSAIPVLKQSATISEIMKQTISAICVICGWVIMFRTAIAYVEKIWPTVLPQWLFVAFSGFLELANGCMQLSKIPQSILRFVLTSVMLSFGGCCVAMQTVSITQALGTGLYFPGKVLQSLCSAILSYAAYSIFLSGHLTEGIVALIVLLIAVKSILIIKRVKIGMEKRGHILYNRAKPENEV